MRHLYRRALILIPALVTAMTAAPASAQSRPAAEERRAARAFLERAATARGAERLTTGVIYTALTYGSGAQPDASDVVRVNYRGTLTNGTEFDTSYTSGQPAEIPLSRAVACWREGVTRMRVGGKATLVCPADMGYGDQGAPPTIPGGAVLIFEIELLGIVPRSGAARGAARERARRHLPGRAARTRIGRNGAFPHG